MQSPQKHKCGPDTNPGLGLEGASCRNSHTRKGCPDKSIWCYTTNPKKRWDFCDPLDPNSVEDMTGRKASGYRGR